MEIRLSDAHAAVSSYSQPVSAVSAAASEASAPVAQGFSSPIIHVDPTVGVAVLMFRNGKTGEVESQIPAKQVIAEYGRHAQPAPRTESAPRPVESAVATVEAEKAPAPAPSPAPAPVLGAAPSSSPVGGKTSILA